MPFKGKPYPISFEDTNERIKNARNRPVTNRQWSTYQYTLDLPKPEDNPHYYEGMNILDIGPGEKYHTYENQPAVIFPGAKLYALDPEFPRFSGERTQLKDKYHLAHDKRAGVSYELPYDDNKFDLIISQNAFPQHVFPVDYPKSLSEMLRTLTPSGEIRLHPCVPDDFASYSEIFKKAAIDIEFPSNKHDRSFALIRYNETIRSEQDTHKQMAAKLKAWTKFHTSILPGDKLRAEWHRLGKKDNFNSLAEIMLARSRIKKVEV